MPLRDTANQAQGKWRGILMTLGVDASFLTKKHGPCPCCGGKDRWRFDDKRGAGTWFCSQCGAGDGFTLLDRLKGWDFKTACKEVEAVLNGGSVTAEPVRAEPTEAELREERNRLWTGAKRITRADLAGGYFAARGFEPAAYPPDLRFLAECPVTGVAGVCVLPAVLALVRDATGKPATLHRTYIKDGAKASIDRPRRLCQGPRKPGSAVRLLPWTSGDHLGIAEGIETALGAAAIFEHPVWSGLDAVGVEGFTPPAGCTRLTIYGDSDTNYRGQKAAFVLAHRLREGRETKHIEVDVHLSVPMGADFADEHLLRVKLSRNEGMNV